MCTVHFCVIFPLLKCFVTRWQSLGSVAKLRPGRHPKKTTTPRETKTSESVPRCIGFYLRADQWHVVSFFASVARSRTALTTPIIAVSTSPAWISQAPSVRATLPGPLPREPVVTLNCHRALTLQETRVSSEEQNRDCICPACSCRRRRRQHRLLAPCNAKMSKAVTRCMTQSSCKFTVQQSPLASAKLLRWARVLGQMFPAEKISCV